MKILALGQNVTYNDQFMYYVSLGMFRFCVEELVQSDFKILFIVN